MNEVHILTLINVLLCLVNLGVLGLTLKLYTELFKDKSMDRRSSKPTP